MACRLGCATPGGPPRATCLNGKDYIRCLETLPWWRAGWCNFTAAWKGLSIEMFKLVVNGVCGSPLIALMLAVVAWSLWAMFRCCACLGRGNAGQVEENGQMLPVDHAQIKPREPPSKWFQAKVAKDIATFCFDILSDLNGIGTFIWTGNFQFACVSFLVFAWSFGQQLATGGFRTFRQEAANSWSEGCLTDGLRRLTLTEKSVEAPLQLLIQFFSFLYVTSNDYAVFSFTVSMLLSLFSVVDAAYTLIELDLLRELSLHEVSTSYHSAQTNSTEAKRHMEKRIQSIKSLQGGKAPAPLQSSSSESSSSTSSADEESDKG